MRCAMQACMAQPSIVLREATCLLAAATEREAQPASDGTHCVCSPSHTRWRSLGGLWRLWRCLLTLPATLSLQAAAGLPDPCHLSESGVTR